MAARVAMTVSPAPETSKTSGGRVELGVGAKDDDAAFGQCNGEEVEAAVAD
jgi:hypothetical protein